MLCLVFWTIQQKSHDFGHWFSSFHRNDYEMLLALDEDNHRHVGASDNQINSLPESIVQVIHSFIDQCCKKYLKIAELESWCVSMCNHLHSSFFARMIMISDLNSRCNDVWFFLCGRLQPSWFLLIDVCSRWQDKKCSPTKKPSPGQNLIFRIISSIDWAHMINCPDSWIMCCTEWVRSVYQLRRKGKKVKGWGQCA